MRPGIGSRELNGTMHPRAAIGSPLAADGGTDNILTTSVECPPTWVETNGLVAAVAKCGKDGVGSAEDCFCLLAFSIRNVISATRMKCALSTSSNWRQLPRLTQRNKFGKVQESSAAFPARRTEHVAESGNSPPYWHG